MLGIQGLLLSTVLLLRQIDRAIRRLRPEVVQRRGDIVWPKLAEFCRNPVTSAKLEFNAEFSVSEFSVSVPSLFNPMPN